MHWLEARALVAANRHAEATLFFERLARVKPETFLADVAYDKRIFGASALAELGHCAFRAGRYRESEDWYRRAEALAPDCLEYRVKREFAAIREATSDRSLDPKSGASTV